MEIETQRSKIGEQIQMVEINHNSFAVEVRNGNVCVNLTKMAKPFEKRVETWLKTREARNYLDALSVTLKSVTTDLVKVTRGGKSELQGTWAYDYRIAMRFAQWLFPHDLLFNSFIISFNSWIRSSFSLRRSEIATAVV